MLVLYDERDPSCVTSHTLVRYAATPVYGLWPKTCALFERMVEWAPVADFYIKLDDNAHVEFRLYEEALRLLRPRYFGVSTLHWWRVLLLSSCPRTRQYYPYAQGSLYALDGEFGRAFARSHEALSRRFRDECDEKRVLHEDRMMGFAAHARNVTLTPSELYVNHAHRAGGSTRRLASKPRHTMTPYYNLSSRWNIVPQTLVTTLPDGANASQYPFWGSCAADARRVVILRDRDFESLLTDLPAGLVRSFRALQHQIARADLARYIYLYKHGGIYVDSDYICFPTFWESAWANDTVAVAEQYPPACRLPTCTRERVGNAFMVSPPRHPFVGGLLRAFGGSRGSLRLGRRVNPAGYTGPGLLTQVLHRHCWWKVKVLPFARIYGVSWYAKEVHPCRGNLTAAACAAWFPPDALGTTVWRGSWLPRRVSKPPPIANLSVHLPESRSTRSKASTQTAT